MFLFNFLQNGAALMHFHVEFFIVLFITFFLSFSIIFLSKSLAMVTIAADDFWTRFKTLHKTAHIWRNFGFGPI